jgi:spore coat protein U-like protein
MSLAAFSPRRIALGLAGMLLGVLATPAAALCLGPVCSCSVSVTALAFGTVNPLAGGTTDSTGSVQIGCGGVAGLLIPYRIDMGTGGGSYATRRLASGAATLNYNLYGDSGHSVIWGDGTAGSQTLNGSILLNILGLAAPVTHTVYGRIASGQTGARPGSYVDTVTVTVTYY